jgi:hypothetical protein
MPSWSGLTEMSWGCCVLHRESFMQSEQRSEFCWQLNSVQMWVAFSLRWSRQVMVREEKGLSSSIISIYFTRFKFIGFSPLL